jgi:2-iminobutanoate/2-iminopropanoate deaminase
MKRKEILVVPQLKPVGAYEIAIKANGFLFVSGIIGIDFTTGQLKNDSFQSEFFQVRTNIQYVLDAAQISWDHIVKTTIYLTDLTHFNELNALYGVCFQEHFPAREVVEVKRLPKDANIEISFIALLNE